VALMFFGGLALTGIGLVAGVWTLAHTLGPATASAGTVVLTIAPLLSGFHMLIHAMVLDIQDNQQRVTVARSDRGPDRRG
jgi:hypothetical protein